MREALVPIFGENGAVVVQYVVTLVVILALIGVVVWLVRRYTGGSAGPTSRNRLPRLAIVDTLQVDNRRRLVLVRRDNVEHLVLIGGPTDLVVEPSILRTRVAQRPGQTPPVRGQAQPGTSAPQPAPPPPPNRSAPPGPSRSTSMRARRAEPPGDDDPIPFPPRASLSRPPVRPESGDDDIPIEDHPRTAGQVDGAGDGRPAPQLPTARGHGEGTAAPRNRDGGSAP